METDYQVLIECHTLTERKSCDTCSNVKVCQYHTEIFDQHGSYKHTINNKRLVNFVAELCKHFNKHLIEWDYESFGTI